MIGDLYRKVDQDRLEDMDFYNCDMYPYIRAYSYMDYVPLETINLEIVWWSSFEPLQKSKLNSLKDLPMFGTKG